MTGRPPKAKEDRRSAVLRVRLTDEERERYQQAADREGLPLSEWVRWWLVQAAGR